MSDEKRRRLQFSLWQIQQRFGERALVKLDQLNRNAAIATGFSMLDELLSTRGIPCSRVSVLTGIPTSGMTTLAHKIIASAQVNDGTTAYIDLSATFDPGYALRCGVALDRLLVVRPADALQGLAIARDLIRESGVKLVILDLADADRSAIALDTALRRFYEPLARSTCAALFLFTPATHWHELDSYTDLHLRIERQAWLRQGRDIRGYLAKITVCKDTRQPGERSITLEITFDGAVNGDGA